MELVLQMMSVRSIRLLPVRGPQLRELAQRLHHLARALAARRDDHHVDVRVAAGDLLQHRLAGAEGPGDAVGAAAGHREEGVDDAHLRGQRLGRAQAFGVGA
jgi:hypothetical protein